MEYLGLPLIFLLGPALTKVFFLIFLLFQYFERVAHLAVIAILPFGPLCKPIYIYTDTNII